MRSTWSPWTSMVSSTNEPPAPQCPLSTESSAGRSDSSAESPQTTVIIRLCFRRSTRTFARCLEGDRYLADAAAGSHWQSSPGVPHRSQVGGMSKGVPAKSRDIGANRFEGGLKVNLRLTERSVNDWHHTDSSSCPFRVTTADRIHPNPVAPNDCLRGVLDGGFLSVFHDVFAAGEGDCTTPMVR